MNIPLQYNGVLLSRLYSILVIKTKCFITHLAPHTSGNPGTNSPDSLNNSLLSSCPPPGKGDASAGDDIHSKCSVANKGNNVWWAGDMGQDKTISSVKIWGRMDQHSKWQSLFTTTDDIMAKCSIENVNNAWWAGNMGQDKQSAVLKYGEGWVNHTVSDSPRLMVIHINHISETF